jgi:ketosteroid isomerase-like protein
VSEPAKNLEIARRYLQAIEGGATGADLASFFAPEVVFEMFPNRLVPRGERQDLRAALESAERGKKVIARQSYSIRHAMADGDRVALEVEWVGTLASPFGSTPEGAR